jgi:fructokinase
LCALQDFKGRVAGVKAKPVDTTGAGDAFVSGFLYNLASDPSILEVKFIYFYTF